MRRDFTPDVYFQSLESARRAGYSFITFKDFLGIDPKPDRCIMIRHDIDALPGKALEFARVENKMQVRSTFFFKTSPGLFDKKLIAEIAELGHEIGYHYEDLANANGDAHAAIRAFEKNLELIRSCYPVTTICMDGSVLSRWNNLDLWKNYNYRDFGIIGEPYLDLDFDLVLYLSDTGRKWNAIRFSMYDKVKTKYAYHNKSTFDIIRDLENGQLPDRIMMTIHPQRWHNGIFDWTVELVYQRIKNMIKFLIIQNKKTGSEADRIYTGV